jgi:glycosyltransferase involved in cell wall biosynthesis
MLGRNSYNRENDTDYQLVKSADAVCSPSIALREILKREWKLNKVEIIPNIFLPEPAYLNLPISENDCRVITYIGRLDVRKGIRAMIEAIPLVLGKYPGVKFRFIGGDGEAANNGGSMKEYILKTLHQYAQSLEFMGYVEHHNIPNYISDTGIFIFPSIWENYPYVCLEAMSAGKAIIASKNGVMKEMLAGINGGVLIDALKPKEIAKAMIWLIENPQVRVKMGYNNRQKMKTWPGEIIRKAEEHYSKIIFHNKPVYRD